MLLDSVLGKKRRFSVSVAVQMELNKDDNILGHGSKRANEPWQIFNHVFPFKRVAKDL